VIARKGFHHATLAEVEAEAGISRGMMTYHFPTKDAMIQGVFDMTVERLRAAIPAPDRAVRGIERIDRIIDQALADGSTDGEFFCLHATFLAQALHRADYRATLAALDAFVRDGLARDLGDAGLDGDDARSLAVILSAALFGLASQIHANPHGFDRRATAARLKQLARSRESNVLKSDRLV
jgi:TetR/AcrR family transcriptional regulator, repressor for uid operon